ncbi:hypothetical protein NCS52_01004000 [Fusarium sp. LHS14.1]|nr:hypothetical protein NCS52_01004000 [Fusarium sp. LHS14.1]
MSAPMEQHDDGIVMPPDEDAPSHRSDSSIDSDSDSDDSYRPDFEALHAEQVARMRATLQSSYPPIEETDFDAIVGPAEPTFTATWKNEDEELMLLEWNSSHEKKAYACIDVDNASLTTLWKVCMRMFRCTPLDLISPLLNLKYGSSTVVFSQEFCDALTPLIVHAIWQGSAQRLAMVLQYAVICRTDDRRPWKPKFRGFGLDLLVSSMDKHSSMPQPIHKMHHEARQRVDQRGQDSGIMSDVMYEVGEIVSEMSLEDMTVTAGCTVYKGHEVYCVTTQDVELVTMAICYAASGVFRTVNDTYELFQEALDNDDPPNAQQIRDFYQRAGRQQLRVLAMAEKRRARPKS